jgi:trehalose 6-phosphate synthase
MRKILLLVLPTLILVAIAFTVFGIFQVRFEEEKLMDDLYRKTRNIAESMELSVSQALEKSDIKIANNLVQKFETRERLQGCIIYDKERKIMAVTNRFSDWADRNQVILNNFFLDTLAKGGKDIYKGNPVYSYIMPVRRENGDYLGAVEIVYDTSYVSNRIGELWKRLSITLIALLIVIFLTLFFIQRQIFFLPLKRLTNWFYLFQRGETNEMHPAKSKGDFGKFASEVEQLALNLRVARRSLSEKASEQLKKEDLWTEEKLRNLIHARLGDNAFFVVSNREPFMHIHDQTTGEIKCIVPAGGVVTALHPMLSACGGTWIAHGSGNADKKFVNSKDKLGVPPDDIRYILKRVWLSKEEEEGYYYGFSNEGLWPLCHNTHTRPIFREQDWQMYKKVNQKFADAILEELPVSKPFIFIQDYHFTLLGKYIKEKRPDATIALFWHIPWPNPEAFSICPYQEEILAGMLGCDLIGFHVQNHCNNFLDTANRLLESRIDTEKYSVKYYGKETFIRPFPISIDSQDSSEKFDPKVLAQIEKIKKEFNLENKIIGVGVDRIDYTKGIVERINAIDRFLEKYPEYKSRFVFIQLGSPSRTHIKRYHELVSEIDETIEKINWKHRTGEWNPILYLKKHFSHEEIEPFFAMADLCIVSSLHDGMNLVAKEYVHAKKDLSGCLLLSQFTGAAREFTDAYLINPYSIEEFAGIIKQAIEADSVEKKLRMKNMRTIISENNVYRWAASIVTELTTLKKYG